MDNVPGIKTPPKTERNLMLWYDWYMKDLTQAQLVARYGISMARVYEIIRPFRIKYPNGPDKDFKLPDIQKNEEERVERLTDIPDFDRLDTEGGE